VVEECLFKNNAICASENFDGFMELSASSIRDHKWKIPIRAGLVVGQLSTSFALPSSIVVVRIRRIESFRTAFAQFMMV
jgi:hypothetical protein